MINCHAGHLPQLDASYIPKRMVNGDSSFYLETEMRTSRNPSIAELVRQGATIEADLIRGLADISVYKQNQAQIFPNRTPEDKCSAIIPSVSISRR